MFLHSTYCELHFLAVFRPRGVITSLTVWTILLSEVYGLASFSNTQGFTFWSCCQKLKTAVRSGRYPNSVLDEIITQTVSKLHLGSFFSFICVIPLLLFIFKLSCCWVVEFFIPFCV